MVSSLGLLSGCCLLHCYSHSTATLYPASGLNLAHDILSGRGGEGRGWSLRAALLSPRTKETSCLEKCFIQGLLSESTYFGEQASFLVVLDFLLVFVCPLLLGKNFYSSS